MELILLIFWIITGVLSGVYHFVWHLHNIYFYVCFIYFIVVTIFKLLSLGVDAIDIFDIFLDD